MNNGDRDIDLLGVISQFSSRSEAGTITTAPRKALNKNAFLFVPSCKTRASTYLFLLSTMLLPYPRSISTGPTDIVVSRSAVIASATKVDNQKYDSGTVTSKPFQEREFR